jgi:hypothetical protein
MISALDSVQFLRADIGCFASSLYCKMWVNEIPEASKSKWIRSITEESMKCCGAVMYSIDNLLLSVMVPFGFQVEF